MHNSAPRGWSTASRILFYHRKLCLRGQRWGISVYFSYRCDGQTKRPARRICYCSAYTPSVTLRVPAPSGREPFGVRMHHTGSCSGPSLRGLAGRHARLREFIRIRILLYFSGEIVKEIPHNMGGSLTDDFQPSAACKFLDLPPVSLRNLQATPD